MTAAFDFSPCFFYLLLYFMLHRLKENDAKIFWVFDHKRNNLLLYLIHNAKDKGIKLQFPGNQNSKPIQEAGSKQGNQPRG